MQFLQMQLLQLQKSTNGSLNISGRDDKKKVMSRKTLVKQIDDLYGAMVDGLKDELSKHEFICITADLWTGSKRI